MVLHDEPGIKIGQFPGRNGRIPTNSNKNSAGSGGCRTSFEHVASKKLADFLRKKLRTNAAAAAVFNITATSI